MLNTETYLFISEGDAWNAIGFLRNLSASVGSATVTDFKHYMGEGALNGDEKVGWTDLSSASVYKGKFGWHISLPELENL